MCAWVGAHALWVYVRTLWGADGARAWESMHLHMRILHACMGAWHLEYCVVLCCVLCVCVCVCVCLQCALERECKHVCQLFTCARAQTRPGVPVDKQFIIEREGSEFMLELTLPC